MPWHLAETVNVKKLSHQLTKEIKRSPAKAAALGGLLLVAVWFWFPLLQGWFGSAGKPVPEANASLPVTLATPNAVTLGPAVSRKTHDWGEVAARMAADPWMKPGELRHSTFDPFFPEKPVEAMVAIAQPTATTPLGEVSPESTGLSVSSVIAGPRPLARINSQNYRIGDRVVAGEGIAPYTVTAIESWGVQLQGQHRSYKLPLNDKLNSSKQRLVLRNGNLISTEN